MDEIKLPKSKVPLRLVTTFEDGAKRWEFLGVVGAFKSAADEWDVWGVDDSAESISRDEAIAWLDAHVLALRAALLPPGARIVEDTPETREKVARRLYELHAQTWKEFNGSVDRPWEDTGLQTRMLGFADAVLAALGVSK